MRSVADRFEGIVGSDPYLAPEVYDIRKYDPQPADVWSLAVIYACMSLRRFPWKCPRLTDNSYKLFASAPTPGTTPAPGPSARSSTEVPNQSSTPNHQKTSDTEGSTRSHHHHHSHHHHDKHGESDESAPSTATPGSRIDAPGKEVLKGPWRLLRLLPRETRDIIGSMLEIDPERRATLQDMLRDPWVTQTPVCCQVEGGKIMNAAGHHHTLERSTTVVADENKA